MKGTVGSFALAAAIVTASAAVARGQGAAVRLAEAANLTGVSVSGRVVSSVPGAPLPSEPLWVGLSSLAGTVVESGARITRVTAAGTFRFMNVPPGSYRVYLQQHGGGLSETIKVGREPLTGVNVTLVKMIEVSVRASVDDRSEAPARIQYFLRSGQRNEIGFIDVSGGPRPISVAPGTKPFLVFPPAGYYVSALRQGTRDLLRHPLQLEPTSPPVELSLQLSRNPAAGRRDGNVLGRVEGHAGVDVELVAHSFATVGAIVGRTVTDAVGNFAFPDVPPGVYSLNIPPAQAVVETVVVLGDPVRLSVSLPNGSIVAGRSVSVVDPSGRPATAVPLGITFAIEAADFSASFPIDVRGFWGAVPPGTYRARVAGLPAGYRVRTLTAGSKDLMREPFVVPAGRPAEVVGIQLEFLRPAP